MNDLLDWLLARLGEKSTWIGIATTAATITGVTLSPENAAAIATVGVTLSGLALTFIKERKAPKPLQ